MPDVFTAAKRSEIMSRIRSRGNERTEIAFVKLLRTAKITGWRRHLPIFGNPDFAFRMERVAVFIDGCYWHGCPRHYSLPRSNRKFWSEKIRRNQRRDEEVAATLTQKGWHVLRFWQHELREPQRVIRKLSRNGIRAKSQTVPAARRRREALG